MKGLPAIATASATATTTTATTTTAAAAATVLCLVDAYPPTIDLLPVHLRNRVLGVGGRVEGHETETARATRVPVGDDLGLRDRTEPLESLTKGLVVRIPAEAANK